MVSATIGLDRTALTTDVGHGKVEAKVIIRSAGGGSDGGCSTGLTPLGPDTHRSCTFSEETGLGLRSKGRELQ